MARTKQTARKKRKKQNDQQGPSPEEGGSHNQQVMKYHKTVPSGPQLIPKSSKFSKNLVLASYLNSSELPENVSASDVINAIHSVVQKTLIGRRAIEGVKEYCICSIQPIIDSQRFDFSTSHINVICKSCTDARASLRLKEKEMRQKMSASYPKGCKKSTSNKGERKFANKLLLASYLTDRTKGPKNVSPVAILRAIYAVTNDMFKRQNLQEYCICEITKELIENFDSKISKIVIRCDTCIQLKNALSREIYKDEKDQDNAIENASCQQRYIVSLEEEEKMKLNSLFDMIGETVDKTFQIEPQNSIFSRMDNLFVGVVSSDENLDEQLYNELVSNENSIVDEYQEILRSVRKLPIFDKKEEILQMIKNNQVVLINSVSGCGKTTQVPQFILDDFIKQRQGSKCRILCAEPQEIYASFYAERISLERNETLGKCCGYITKYKRTLHRSSGAIVFCSTSMALSQLHHHPNLDNISHIIIDKLHEKDIMADMLLLFLKEVIQTNKSLRIILLNSCHDTDRISGIFSDCAKIDIPFEIQESKELFFEDYFKEMGYRNEDLPKKDPRHLDAIADAAYEIYIDSLQEKLDANDIIALKSMCFKTVLPLIIPIVDHIVKNSDEGSILIFLPATQEIDLMMEEFEKHKVYFNHEQFLILPVHSALFSIPQSVFLPAPKGIRKIVLCTNIVERSLWINDIDFVIDCGNTVVGNYYHPKRAFRGGRVWMYGSSMNDRKRVCRKGVKYNLFTQFHYNRFKEEFTKNELSCDEVILKLKMLNCNDTQSFLTKSNRQFTYKATITELQDMGAIDESENLTKLGYFLASFPLPLKVSKILIYGVMFGCLDPILTIVACLETDDPFAEGKAKCKFSDGSNSDLVSIANAYKAWENVEDKKTFCEENGLKQSTMKIIVELKEQFILILNQFGFIDSVDTNTGHLNVNSGDLKLIQTIVSACLYPNLSQHVYLPWEKKKKKLTLAFVNFKKYSLYFFKSVCSHWNAEQHNFSYPYFAYFKNVSRDTSFRTLNLKHVSGITPLTLLLFCGSIKFQHKEGQGVISMHNKISFHCTADVADKIIVLRKMFDNAIGNYLTRISSSVLYKSENNESVFQAVFDLISNEKLKMPTSFTSKPNPIKEVIIDEKNQKNLEEKADTDLDSKLIDCSTDNGVESNTEDKKTEQVQPDNVKNTDAVLVSENAEDVLIKVENSSPTDENRKRKTDYESQDDQQDSNSKKTKRDD